MEVFIKIAPQEFSRLRERITSDSPAHEAIDRATPIDHAIEGVLFEGYNITCDENQARTILEVAQECSEIIPDIEQAIKLARPV
ncbi:MAG: hypothetical protein GEU77_02455 [Deltaproteobacteria bacterium]|nr:hypothetical protein [Deltaproteobacteria bacterium]